MSDPDRVRGRALRALAAVVAVALGLSGILAVGAYAAARMAGLTADSGGHRGTAQAGPAAPSRASSTTAPTGRPHGQPDAQRQQSHADHVRHHQHQGHHRHHRHRPSTGAVTLHAAQARVHPMSRVDLGGRCGCRSGTTLVVQRLEHGHWSRFPASATASRGRFHTWVMTGRPGPNRFRVLLPGGPASNPVTITVT